MNRARWASRTMRAAALTLIAGAALAAGCDEQVNVGNSAPEAMVAAVCVGGEGRVELTAYVIDAERDPVELRVTVGTGDEVRSGPSLDGLIGLASARPTDPPVGGACAEDAGTCPAGRMHRIEWGPCDAAGCAAPPALGAVVELQTTARDEANPFGAPTSASVTVTACP
ncbi:MAG: hypothetical protein KC620_19965 [Myxococcales bacterium]|nr:hypothetical protein [Myxococcales bacterium]